jgi:hypothetical protein
MIAADNFGYPDGNLAGQTGGTGWTAEWVNSVGVPTVANGRVQIDSTSGQQAARTVNYQFKADGRVLWMRFASIISSEATTEDTSTYGGVGFYSGEEEKMLVGKAWGYGYTWALIAGGVNAFSTNSLRTASVVYVRISFAPEGDDQLDMWVNPANPSALESVTPDATRTVADLSFDTVRLRGGMGISVKESWKFDDFALADSLADITVPVPAPNILVDPVATSVLPGGNAFFNVSAVGTGLGYQWYQDSTKLADGGVFSGTKTSQLTLSGVTSANAGGYTCVVTNSTGSATSMAANLTVAAVATFANQTPADGSVSVLTNAVVSVQVSEGAFLDTTAIRMSINGNAVTPVITVVDQTATVAAPADLVLASGAQQTAKVWLTDRNGNSFTNSWDFRTGFAALPAVLPGPFKVANGGPGLTIFTTAGEGWLGANYDASANRTFFVRFSATFHDMNGESGSGGCYGGLELYNGDSERFLMGNNWASLNWSIAATVPDSDLNPVVGIVMDEWHTIVARIQFHGGTDDSLAVWLDPDFTQSLDVQPQTPLEFTGDFSFDNIHLRCGNGTANVEFTNIICAATATEIGFAGAAEAQLANISPADGVLSASVSSPLSVDVIKGSYALKTSSVVMKLDEKTVTPVITDNAGILNISYQPAANFEAGSFHSWSLSIQDNGGQTYSGAWTFTCDIYPSLPMTNTESYTISGGGSGQVIYTADNGWIHGNYGNASTNTLFISFSITYHDVNGETGGGGCYGGVELYNGDSERFLMGNNWASVNWSVAVTAPDTDMIPVTPIVLEETHVIVAKLAFAPGASDTVSVWLDPDFSASSAESVGETTIGIG